MGRFLKFWFLTRREKHLFFEAGILLLLFNVCVKTLAFRYIENFLRARWNDCAPDTGRSHADDINLIILSLFRVANLFPWKSLCLSRSIAAFVMLRRRGIPAVMLAGAKFSEHSSLIAHAWVHTGHEISDSKSENSEFIAVVRIGNGPW